MLLELNWVRERSGWLRNFEPSQVPLTMCTVLELAIAPENSTDLKFWVS